MRFTVDEYSKRFKMSKEMIKSKIKARKLSAIVENDIIYILTDDTQLNENNHTVKSGQKKSQNFAVSKTATKITVGTIISLLQKENQQLKNRIDVLESKIDKLVEDKEQMLREERDRIEHIYLQKDEQLKSMLELINTKLLLENNASHKNRENPVDVVETVSHQENTAYISPNKSNHTIELKKYLNHLELSKEDKKIITKRFKELYGSDIRILKKDDKYYLDFAKFDYSDLLTVS